MKRKIFGLGVVVGTIYLYFLSTYAFPRVTLAEMQVFTVTPTPTPSPIPTPTPSPSPTPEPTPTPTPTPELTYVGAYGLTAYCSCVECSGPWGIQTASGRPCVAGHTVACNSIPLGTTIYIDGYGQYVVEDTGAMGGGIVDIYFDTHSETEAFGRRSADVYIVN